MKHLLHRALTILAALALLLAWAAPAHAHHNTPTATITTDQCTVTGTTAWPLDVHQVTSTELVILAAGVVHHAPIGTPLTVDLEPGTTAVLWRVWGGGERDYDNPQLTDLDALVTYLEGDGTGPLDPAAPGVAWHTLQVDTCPKPEPTATSSPSLSPSPSVSTTAAATTTATTTATAAATLPVTGPNTPGLALAAITLVVIGAALLALARRHREATDE